MKTIEQLCEFLRTDDNRCLDGRNAARAKTYITGERPFTRENILTQLQLDVAFGFEKALDRRGISSGMMADVVCMWNWVLNEGLENFKDYAQYGLPIFKATALKYGFPNPIENDTGRESKYEA